MRHYEIVFLVHPDQSEQVPAMVERYKAMVEADGGVVHRAEDWGRRQLAYPVQRLLKAHYYLLNVEIGPKVLKDLKDAFHYNDAVLRHLILEVPGPVTEASYIFKTKDEKPTRRRDEEFFGGSEDVPAQSA